MSTENKAREILWPTDDNILLRAVFLYVGQGSSTIMIIADGTTYKTILIDINLDHKNGGTNVPALISDLLDENVLDLFINTHPHNDHLSGIKDLLDNIQISEVWHSGHKPGKKHDASSNILDEILQKIKDAGGSIRVLKGSRDEGAYGDATYYVLAPAEYVIEDLEGEDPEGRDRRIHEQCVVLRFGQGGSWILIPGDADRDAFEKHITQYHEDRLDSVVLAAPHHGSRSFFKHNEDDEPYLDALESIGPDYVIISSPKQSESEHNHPHQDALDIYTEIIGKDNILHTGAMRYCFICDIFKDGTYSGIYDDKGALVAAYPLDAKSNDGDKGGKTAIAPGIIGGTRVDDRPMGFKQ